MSKNAKKTKLSNKDISAIAQQLRDGQGTASKSKSSSNQSTGKGVFFWGALSGAVLTVAAPLFRPVMRSAVKGGIQAGRYAKQWGSTLKEEFEDITAEAQAELDARDASAESNL